MLYLGPVCFRLHDIIHADWVEVTDTSYLNAWLWDINGKIHEVFFYPCDNLYEVEVDGSVYRGEHLVTA